MKLLFIYLTENVQKFNCKYTELKVDIFYFQVEAVENRNFMYNHLLWMKTFLSFIHMLSVAASNELKVLTSKYFEHKNNRNLEASISFWIWNNTHSRF